MRPEKTVSMIARFSIYGFLKNLRFFEPFFLLFLRERGLSFLEIGLLFSFREICVNIMEVPSGALADLFGRKSVMLLSLVSYIASFAIFGVAGNMAFLYLAMFFFAVGEAFRTGTHKAMIFDWLRHEGRESEKTRVYGYTRSWSQKGSALSVLLAAGLVFYSGNYEYVFWFSIIPYILGLWNMALYPSWLNRRIKEERNIASIFAHLGKAIKTSFKKPPVRQLIFRSMVFGGQFKAVKDYLQVIIKAEIAAIPVFLALGEEKRVAVLIGVVYFVLYLLTSYASKNAFRIVKLFGSKLRASFAVIVIALITMIASGLGTYHEIYIVPVFGFLILYNLQNIHRPILISSFDDCAESDQHATVLSIESQSISVGVFLLAPIVGYAVDRFGLSALFWVVSILLGLYFAYAMVFLRQQLIIKPEDPEKGECK